MLPQIAPYQASRSLGATRRRRNGQDMEWREPGGLSPLRGRVGMSTPRPSRSKFLSVLNLVRKVELPSCRLVEARTTPGQAMSERIDVVSVDGEESMCQGGGPGHELLDRIFARYGLASSDARRIGVRVLAGALPVLARGGEIVFREPSGQERAYSFPRLKVASH